MVNLLNDILTDLKNGVNKNKILENENLDKVTDTVEKVLNFVKQQKGK